MAWFRVDDQLPKNRKARALLKASDDKRRDSSPFGIWALAGAWSNDGFVPCDILDDWDDDWRDLAERLVSVGLWHHFKKDGEPGYVFHDWEDQNPTTVNDPSGAGTFGNHVKWHVNRDQTSPDCIHCDRGEIACDIGANRGESDRLSLPPVPPDPTRPSEPSKLDAEFAEWYALYPRKKAKADALKAYRAARKKVEAEVILRGLRRLLPELNTAAEIYRPYPASWLRSESWEDEPSNVHQLRTDDQGREILPPLPGRSPWSAS